MNIFVLYINIYIYIYIYVYIYIIYYIYYIYISYIYYIYYVLYLLYFYLLYFIYLLYIFVFMSFVVVVSSFLFFYLVKPGNFIIAIIITIIFINVTVKCVLEKSSWGEFQESNSSRMVYPYSSR